MPWSISWTVIFTVSLAVLFFTVKFFIARRPKFDDLIVAAADLPAVLSATCCSLLLAHASLVSPWQPSAVNAISVAVILVVQTFFLRLVEDWKFSLSTNWLKAVAVLITSYALFFFVSFQAASESYASIGK